MSRLRPAFLLALAACAGPPALPAQVELTPPPRPTASAAPIAPAIDPAVVAVAAVAAPEHFALDGDIAEWDSLGPAAPSRVGVAFTPEGALLAGDLGGAAREGVWIGLDLEPPGYPAIGAFVGTVEPLDCEKRIGGTPRILADLASCRAIAQRYGDFVSAEQARFRHIYRVDRDGVRRIEHDGSTRTVEGARIAFKPTPRGMAFEARLPARALPRTSQAPLASLRMFAIPALDAAPPVLARDRWPEHSMPAEVGFAPWAALREAAFRQILDRGMLPSAGASYQPGDGLEIEWVGFTSQAHDAVSTRQELLYVKRRAFGALEIGDVFTGKPFGHALGILREGAFVELVPIAGDVRALVERDGALHVLSYWNPAEDGFENAAWAVTVIDREGKLDAAVTAESPSFEEGQVGELHSASWDVLGVSGWRNRAERQGQEIVVRWDAQKRAYVRQEKATKTPRLPAGKGRRGR